LRISVCSTFLARRPGVLADLEAGSPPDRTKVGNAQRTTPHGLRDVSAHLRYRDRFVAAA